MTNTVEGTGMFTGQSAQGCMDGVAYKFAEYNAKLWS